MEYINLGRTDLKVSRLCVGALAEEQELAGNPHRHQSVWTHVERTKR